MKRQFTLGVASTLCAISMSALGQEAPAWQFDATARSDVFHATQPSQDDSLVWTGQIKAIAPLSGSTQVRLDARVSTPRRTTQETDHSIESRLLEWYASHHFGSSELRLGKQIVVWGRADGINPTDNLSPRDYATWLPFDDDQRFGTWALRYDLQIDTTLGLTLFVSPWFESSLIALPSMPNPITSPRPARNVPNSQFGVRLNRSGETLDWSLSYFRGLGELPGLRLLGVDALGPKIELRHDRIDVLGFDMARNFGRFGVRAEAAWTTPLRSDDGAPAIRRPDLFCVAGIDRTFFEHLYINVQWFGRRVQHFVDPSLIDNAERRAVDIRNAITFGQQDRMSQGYTLRVSHKWLGDMLEAEWLVIYNRTRKDRFMRPTLSYAFTDHLRAAIGAVVYQGANETAFGSKKSNNRAFLELRYAL